MIVTMISYTEEKLEERDYCDMFAIEIDGKKVFHVYDGEPEDNSLARNFNDLYKLKDILETMWLAGKEGQDLEFKVKQVEEY